MGISGHVVHSDMKKALGIFAIITTIFESFGIPIMQKRYAHILKTKTVLAPWQIRCTQIFY
jgi:hypothetical protein